MLTDEQRKRVREAAEAAGHDPDEAEKMADGMAGSDGGEAGASEEPAKKSPAADAPKLFQYHLPFITVAELRSAISGAFPDGLGSIADDGLPCGEWLEKHGGALAPGKGKGEGAAPAADDAEA
jgi:hypothetical protein